jgi:ABC-type polysaccharide/polyol phosphate transport system ATPase subunit
MFSFSLMTNGNSPAALCRVRSMRCKASPSRKTAAGDYLALKGIDLALEAGEFVSIVGKPGSGNAAAADRPQLIVTYYVP